MTHILSVLSAKKGFRKDKMRSRVRSNSKKETRQSQTHIRAWIARFAVISFGSRGSLSTLKVAQQMSEVRRAHVHHNLFYTVGSKLIFTSDVKILHA